MSPKTLNNHNFLIIIPDLSISIRLKSTMLKFLQLLLPSLLSYLHLLLLQLLLKVLTELLALSSQRSRHIIVLIVFISHRLKSVFNLLFSHHFVPFFLELLLGGRVAHVFSQQLLAEVLGQGFGDFVDLRLKSVIFVIFLLFHFSDNFFLFSILSV